MCYHFHVEFEFSLNSVFFVREQKFKNIIYSKLESIIPSKNVTNLTESNVKRLIVLCQPMLKSRLKLWFHCKIVSFSELDNRNLKFNFVSVNEVDELTIINHIAHPEL